MRHHTRPRRVLLLLAGLLTALWFAVQARRTPGPPPALERDQLKLSTDRFLQLEQERKRIDQTLWRDELLALECEYRFTDLWDALRTNSDRFGAARSFPFQRLVLPARAGGSRSIGPEIVIRRFDGRIELDAAQWSAWLGKRQAEGYQLDQSEWRQHFFRRIGDTAAQSVIAMELHLTRAEPPERLSLHGDLQVDWLPGGAGRPGWFPESITVSNLELRLRSGLSPFQIVAWREIQPRAENLFIDPLIVTDIDADGYSDIILAANNLVYRNRAGQKFEADTFCDRSLPQPLAGLAADFTHDARADYVCVTHEGVFLFVQEDGRFPRAPRQIWQPPAPLLNPFVLTAGDIDADGDLDVWLAQYKLPYVAGQMPAPYYDANDGFPAYLLVNDSGTFSDRTEERGLAPKRFRRTYSSSWVDLDDDRDLDLVVVSDFAGVDLYQNNGRGFFTDTTGSWVDEPHAFGMAHCLADFNRDTRLDLFMVGMDSAVARRLEGLGAEPPAGAARGMRAAMAYGNRLYLGGPGGFRQGRMSDATARTGWSWGASPFDSDNDGYVDLYIANGHKSRATTRDYESQFWRHDIYIADSRHDPGVDLFFQTTGNRLYGAGWSYGGYYKNQLLLNQRGTNFVNVAPLYGVAMEADSRNVVADDLDRDGRVDLVVTTFEEWPAPRQTLTIFRNRLETAHHWLGVELIAPVNAATAGAQVHLITAGGVQKRWLVNGDSYRSQHALNSHFGLGTQKDVTAVEVIWADGKTNRLEHPPIDRYHRIGR